MPGVVVSSFDEQRKICFLDRERGGGGGGDLEDEGWADGGVEGAHAVKHCITSLQLRQQGGVGVREDLMVLLPAPMAQVEDALHCRLQLGTCQALVHLAGAWSVCKRGPCSWSGEGGTVHAVSWGQDCLREREGGLGTGSQAVDWEEGGVSCMRLEPKGSAGVIQSVMPGCVMLLHGP